MKLTKLQFEQLDRLAKNTRVKQGHKNNDEKTTMAIGEFKKNTFYSLIKNQLVIPSEFNPHRYYISDKGFKIWLMKTI